MGGLVGLTPEQVGTAVSASEAMKTGPIERGYKKAVTEKLLKEPLGLTYEQQAALKRIEPDLTLEEKEYFRAGAFLRRLQALTAFKGDYKASQQYDDARNYYNDLYRKIQDEFGVWKQDLWQLEKTTKATEGMWKGMTYAQATSELASMIDEDMRRIWKGESPHYATGTKGDVRGKGVADRDIGGLIDLWNLGR